MLVLEAGEICPYGNRCPHNKKQIIDGVYGCFGCRSDRPGKFTCEYVTNGVISTEGTRLPGDFTGKMRILTES